MKLLHYRYEVRILHLGFASGHGIEKSESRGQMAR